MRTFRDVIAIWKTPEVMAGEIRGVTIDMARHWKTRDSIPAEHWHLVIQAAAKKGVPLDVALFQKFRARAKRNGAKIITAA